MVNGDNDRTAQMPVSGQAAAQGEEARRMVSAGNPQAAHALLVEAVKSAPTDISLWLNLAAVLRELNRAAEEMAALDKVLTLEPRHIGALLQKASLLETHGEARKAAVLYRTALQAIPPGAQPAPRTVPILEHARNFVEANNRALESFLEERPRAVAREFRRSAAAPFRPLPCDAAQERAHLPPAADIPVLSATADDRILRARRIPVAGRDRGGHRRHPRGARERPGGWTHDARALCVAWRRHAARPVAGAQQLAPLGRLLPVEGGHAHRGAHRALPAHRQGAGGLAALGRAGLRSDGGVFDPRRQVPYPRAHRLSTTRASPSICR